jgi:hypothetical protein
MWPILTVPHSSEFFQRLGGGTIAMSTGVPSFATLLATLSFKFRFYQWSDDCDLVLDQFLLDLLEQ